MIIKNWLLTSMIALVAISIVPSAQAKTPPEVLKPYKAYKAALKDGKRGGDAAEYAYEAWQKAEELIGDSRITGDLASNYALTNPVRLNGRSGDETVEKAFERAIELSEYHDDMAVDVELQRRIMYVGWSVDQYKYISNGFDHQRVIQREALVSLGRRLKETGYEASTYGAEYLTLKAQAALNGDNKTDAEENAKLAIAMFEAADDEIPSAHRFFARIFLADILMERENLVGAALQYQAVMVALEGEQYGHDNPTSAAAYSRWLEARSLIALSPEDHPGSETVLNFELPESRLKTFQPLLRVPPKFPSRFLQGAYSGYVNVKFDVDLVGRPENITVVSATSRSLIKPAIKSIEKWKYAPNASESDRTGIESKITFELSRANGKMLPYGKEIKL